MDCAKGIGIVTSNPGHILDYEGVDLIPNPLPPMIPSTAGSKITDIHALEVLRLLSLNLPRVLYLFFRLRQRHRDEPGPEHLKPQEEYERSRPTASDSDENCSEIYQYRVVRS
jgi:hypothetical protein